VNKTDRVAVVAEANLFFTILCLLMLKMNLAGEYLPEGFYDSALVTSNVIASVLPLFMTFVLSLVRLATEFIDSSNAPPKEGDSIRILECPSNPECRLRRGKVVSVVQHGLHHVTVDDSVDGSLEITVAVNLGTAADFIRSSLCRRNGSREALSITLDGRQVQKVASKKDLLKLIGGVCKQCMKCVKGARRRLSESESDDDSSDDEEIDVKQAAQQAALARAGKVLEPLLQKHGLLWAQVQTVLEMLSPSKIGEIVQDPEEFLRSLVATAGPYAKRLALSKLRPKIEPVLSLRGLAWTDVVPAFDLVESLEDLQEALLDPESFLDSLVAAGGAAAKKIAVAMLHPPMKPQLLLRKLDWSNVSLKLEMMSMDELAMDPMALLDSLGAATERLHNTFENDSQGLPKWVFELEGEWDAIGKMHSTGQVAGERFSLRVSSTGGLSGFVDVDEDGEFDEGDSKIVHGFIDESSRCISFDQVYSDGVTTHWEARYDPELDQLLDGVWSSGISGTFEARRTRQHAAAIKIQAMCRGRAVRNEVQRTKQNAAAIRIQAACRGRIGRKQNPLGWKRAVKTVRDATEAAKAAKSVVQEAEREKHAADTRAKEAAQALAEATATAAAADIAARQAAAHAHLW
jgi:hypothetical protein